MNIFSIFLLLALLGCSNAQVLLLSGSGNNNPYTTLSNIDDITTQTSSAPPGWEKCVKSGCNPGGSGTFPPATLSQTFNVSSPSIDGNSMQMNFVEPSVNGGTNWLETYKVLGGSSQNAFIAGLTHFHYDVSLYADVTAGTYTTEYEIDHGIFSPSSIGSNTPNGTNYMFGSQCKQDTGIFQIFNQAANDWVDATYSGGTIPCSLTPGQWNNVQAYVHLVLGDQSACTNGGLAYPLLHWDLIIINGTSYIPTNTNTCAGNLNASFASLLFIQVQADTGNKGTESNPANIYYDKITLGYY